jgi:hypothetical protein
MAVGTSEKHELRIEGVLRNGLTPQVTAVGVVTHGVLRVRFADGHTGAVDVIGLMQGPEFAVATTSEGFEKCGISADGEAVEWPDGGRIEAAVLYERVA